MERLLLALGIVFSAIMLVRLFLSAKKMADKQEEEERKELKKKVKKKHDEIMGKLPKLKQLKKRE